MFYISNQILESVEFLAYNQSYPPVESDGGNALPPSPHETLLSSVNSNSTVEPFLKMSQSR